eukprot:g5083.t1
MSLKIRPGMGGLAYSNAIVAPHAKAKSADTQERFVCEVKRRQDGGCFALHCRPLHGRAAQGVVGQGSKGEVTNKLGMEFTSAKLLLEDPEAEFTEEQFHKTAKGSKAACQFWAKSQKKTNGTMEEQATGLEHRPCGRGWRQWSANGEKLRALEVSPPANPNIIYAGGQNNGASSGVLKSADGGAHWTVASNGMFNTRVQALGIVDKEGDHVYCAVPGGIYETTDGAASWHLINGSNTLGTCHSFKNGTIDSEPFMFASCDIGIANIPIGRSGASWSVIPPGGWGRAGYLTVSDSLQNTSVLGGCLGGHVFIGTVVNRTYANWTSFPDRPCVMLALNPNNKDHFIYTHPPITYQSMDGGKTYENLNHSNIFHCGIDRKGWLYTAAMGGAFVSKDCGPGPGMKRPCSWQGYYDKRVQRRTNASMVRGAHDYQRISLDFGADSTGLSSVAFSSDQGLFIKPLNDSSLELIKANGNMSNNIALKACVSKGDGGPDGRYIVTAVWDWAPLASWDSGQHWPSWQAPDGYSGSCIGEGGGAYGMGASNHMLLMHHHNIMASPIGGKNLSRFVVPRGATVFGPAYQSLADGTVEGRTMPSGAVYAPLFFAPIPFAQRTDQVLATPGFQANCTDMTADMPQHTNYSCLATIDLGTQYGWYKSINYALWNGLNQSCHVCSLSGNVSLWTYANKTGLISYSQPPTIQARSQRDMATLMAQFDFDGDGRIDGHDLARSMVNDSWAVLEEERERGMQFGGGAHAKPKAYRVLPHAHRERHRQRESNAQKHERHLDEMSQHDRSGTMTGRTPQLSSAASEKYGGVELGGGAQFIIKNFNYGVGMNWTWTQLPPHLAGIHSFSTDPTSNATLYAVAADCIAKSHDGGDTWDPCWNATNLTGSFADLVIKNSSTMIAVRNGAVPLRTFDSGGTWQPLDSTMLVASFSHGVLWSWTGNTLIMLGSGGSQSDEHPHAAYVWKSTDDGDTWTDETGDLVTMGPGAAQWYENDFYINSMGQGIQVKTLET